MLQELITGVRSLSSSTKESTIALSQVNTSPLNQVTGTKKDENVATKIIENGLGGDNLQSVPYSKAGNFCRSTTTESNCKSPYNKTNYNLKSSEKLNANRSIVSASSLVCVSGHHSGPRKLKPLAPKVSCNTAVKTNNISSSSELLSYSFARSEPQNIAQQFNNREVSVSADSLNTNVAEAITSLSTYSPCKSTESNALTSLPVSDSSRGDFSHLHTTVTMAASSEGSFNSTSSLFRSNHSQNSELSITTNNCLALAKNCDNQRVFGSVSGSNLDSDSQTSSMVVFVNHPNKNVTDGGIQQGRTISGSVQGHVSCQSFPSDTAVVVSNSNCISYTKEKVVNSGCEVQKILAGQHSGQHPSDGVPHIVTQEGNSFGQNNTLSTNHSQNHLTMSFEDEVIQSPYYSSNNGLVAHRETLGIHSSPQSGLRSFAGSNTFVTYSPGSRQSLQTVQLAGKGDVFQNCHNSSQMMSISTKTSLPANNTPQSNSNVTLLPARSPSLPRQSPESLGFDFGDLQGLEPFDVDILDSDINVLSEYFLSSEDSSSERFPPTMGTENVDSTSNSANLMEHLNSSNPQLSSANNNPGSTLERATSTDDSLRVVNGFRNGTVTNKVMQSSTEAPSGFQTRKDFGVSTSLYAGGTFGSTDQSSIKSLTGTTQETSWSPSIDSFLNKRPGQLMSVDGQFLATHKFGAHQTALKGIQTVHKSHVPLQKTGDVSVGRKRQTQSDAGDEQILGNQSNLISNDINMETVSSELKNDLRSAHTTSFKVVASDNLLNVNDSFSVGSDSPKTSGAQVHVEFATNDISLNSVDHLLLQSDSLVGQAALPNDTQYHSISVAQSLCSNNDSLQSSFTNSLSSQSSQYQFTSPCVPGSASIIDYSPEWSYPEGGVKVLVTGEWYNSDASYTCLFDGCSVPASLIQSGCLRCFCPSHDPGLVTLQVASNGFIVSNACVFEYRVKDSPGGQGSFHEWLAMDEGRFKVAILERLEQLESRLNLAQQKNGMGFCSISSRQRNDNFEERLVRACHFISNHEIVECSLGAEILYRGMSVLHLAAALGFDKLVQNLLQWRKQTTSAIIQQELNPQRKDKFSCTPLMWACALGHTKVVLMLLECDSDVLVVADARGRLPLQVARDRGYLDVVDAIQLHVSVPVSRYITYYAVVVYVL